MVGNSMEEGLLLQNSNPAHTSATLPAVLMVAVVWLGCLIVFNLIDYSPLPEWLIVTFSAVFGISAGYATKHFFKRLSERRREKLAAQYRADQDAETRRKMAEAREAGLI